MKATPPERRTLAGSAASGRRRGRGPGLARGHDGRVPVLSQHRSRNACDERGGNQMAQHGKVPPGFRDSGRPATKRLVGRSVPKGSQKQVPRNTRGLKSQTKSTCLHRRRQLGPTNRAHEGCWYRLGPRGKAHRRLSCGGDCALPVGENGAIGTLPLAARIGWPTAKTRCPGRNRAQAHEQNKTERTNPHGKSLAHGP